MKLNLFLMEKGVFVQLTKSIIFHDGNTVPMFVAAHCFGKRIKQKTKKKNSKAIGLIMFSSYGGLSFEIVTMNSTLAGFVSVFLRPAYI